MNAPGRQLGALRKKVAELLRSDQFDERISERLQFSLRQVVNPLLSFLCSGEEKVKWGAVTAVGVVVAELADQDMEAARTIMRRLMWSLNDESGGIGWGSAEAMGEIMARHKRLADEYHCILVSYIRDDCDRLGNESLETGVLWGMGRLAGARPGLLAYSIDYVFPYTRSKNPNQRGLALWVLGALRARRPATALETLLEDHVEITLYERGEFNRYRISELARRIS